MVFLRKKIVRYVTACPVKVELSAQRHIVRLTLPGGLLRVFNLLSTRISRDGLLFEFRGLTWRLLIRMQTTLFFTAEN